MTTKTTKTITLTETADGEPITASNNSWDVAYAALPDYEIVAVDHDRDEIHVTVSVDAGRSLEHRHNNGYDSVLLIEDGVVIGAWTVGERGDELDNFASPGDLNDWEATWPDETDPAGYGELVAKK